MSRALNPTKNSLILAIFSNNNLRIKFNYLASVDR